MSQENIVKQKDIDQHWMDYALGLANQAQELGEVPVGAALVDSDVEEPFGRLIGEGFNQPISNHDATAHAEINAIRLACQNVGNYRLPNTTLYVTLEPCSMCAGAIIHSRIARVVIAAKEPRAGAAGSALNILQNDQFNHRCEVLFGVKGTTKRRNAKSVF